MPYTGLSGGAGAASALDDVLNRRKQDTRQAMLDELQKQSVQSEVAYRQSQAESMAAERASQAEARTSEAENRRALTEEHQIKMMGAGHRSGDDLTGLDPKLVELGRRYGMIDMQSPQVTVNEGPINPEASAGPLTPTTISQGGNTPPQAPRPSPHPVWMGDADERQGLERQLAIQNVMKDPNISQEMKQYLSILSATGNLEKGFNPPAGLLEKEDKPVYWIDRDGKQMKNIGSAPAGSHFQMQPAPPSVNNYALAPFFGPGDTPMNFDRRTGGVAPAPIAGGGGIKNPNAMGPPDPASSNTPTGGAVHRLPNAGAAGAGAKTVVPSSAASGMRAALGNYGRAQKGEQGSIPVEQAKQALQVQQAQVINEAFKSRPDLAKVAWGILNDPNKGKVSVDEILGHIQGLDADPEASQLLRAVLPYLLYENPF